MDRTTSRALIEWAVILAVAVVLGLIGWGVWQMV